MDGQLELHLDGSKCDTEAFAYGFIHNLIQTITLFLQWTDSAEAVIAAADACVKTMGYIGKEKKEHEGRRSYSTSAKKKAIDAIESLCERIIGKAHAPDAACGKRNRAAYEKDFASDEDA